MVQDGARRRSGYHPIPAAVLQNQRHRHLRMLIRGKQGVEDMVAQTHRDHFGVIGLVLLQAKDLRGPGLRRDLIRRSMKQLIAGAVGLIRHPIHAVAHNAPVRDFGSPTCGRFAGC